MIGFDKEMIKLSTEDGHNVLLLENLNYSGKHEEYVTIPAGFWSDGASTPSFLWATLPPSSL